MFDSLISKDIELLIYLNNLGTVQWDGFWLFVTNKYSAIPLYLFLLYFTFKKFGFKKTFIVILFVIILITISDQTSNLFKHNFKRLRPCHNENILHLLRMVKARCGGLYAFFSAHASNSMAIAVFFGFLLRSKFIYILQILVLWAIVVAYSRVYIAAHYPLDILVGMFFGILYGTLLYKLFMMFLKRFMN